MTPQSPANPSTRLLLEPTLEVVAVKNPPAGQPPLLSSSQLFRDQKTLHIEHGGQCYVLRLTKENKLILTK